MLKFQEEYSIAYQSFEDFILVIFVLVDDLYKKVAPDSIKYRRNFLELRKLKEGKKIRGFISNQTVEILPLNFMLRSRGSYLQR